MSSGAERVSESKASANQSNAFIPLHELRIDDEHYESGIRVLLQPVIHQNAQELQLNTPPKSFTLITLHAGRDHSRQTHVMAVTQTSVNTKFSLRTVGGVSIACDLYYDTFTNGVVLHNTSTQVIDLTFIKSDEGNNQIDSHIGEGETRFLDSTPLTLGHSGVELLNLRVLERLFPSMPTQGAVTSSSDFTTKTKRAHPPSQESVISATEQPRVAPQRLKTGHGLDNVVAVFDSSRVSQEQRSKHIKETGDDAEQRELVLELHAVTPPTVISHPLLLGGEQTLDVPGVGELDSYKIKKTVHLASSGQSEVYVAENSRFDAVVVVKVLKPMLPEDLGDRTKSVIRHARTWENEYRIQKGLQHDSIVRLFGGDARFFTLFFEHIPGSDLSKRGIWRGEDNKFCGQPEDGHRIWADMASALHLLHSEGVHHNDIKPANIIYDINRGAILCDFGLALTASSPLDGQNFNGGTPYYVPPEFVDTKSRGVPGDVWALGITMLYVLRHIILPEANAYASRENRLHWRIAEIHQESKGEKRAVAQMRAWVSRIRTIRDHLTAEDDPEYILRDMLEETRTFRVTSAELVKRLKSAVQTREHYLQRRGAGRGASIERNSPGHGSTTEENTSIEADLETTRL